MRGALRGAAQPALLIVDAGEALAAVLTHALQCDVGRGVPIAHARTAVAARTSTTGNPTLTAGAIT